MARLFSYKGKQLTSKQLLKEGKKKNPSLTEGALAHRLRNTRNWTVERAASDPVDRKASIKHTIMNIKSKASSSALQEKIILKIADPELVNRPKFDEKGRRTNGSALAAKFARPEGFNNDPTTVETGSKILYQTYILSDEQHAKYKALRKEGWSDLKIFLRGLSYPVTLHEAHVVYYAGREQGYQIKCFKTTKEANEWKLSGDIMALDHSEAESLIEQLEQSAKNR